MSNGNQLQRDGAETLTENETTPQQAVKNVFVLGMGDGHPDVIQSTCGTAKAKLNKLIREEELRGVEEFPVKHLLEKARNRLNNFEGQVDAIVSFLDFPATEIAAILSREYRTPGPSLEVVLRNNHKYWSRCLQKEVIPEAVPEFCCFNPYSENPLEEIDISYPFWIKPLCGYNSHLGFRINNESEFREVLPTVREGLPKLANAFNYILQQAKLPGQVKNISAFDCIAEKHMTGKQCLLEGYMHNGEAVFYGLVDALRESNRCSFSRLHYPSNLPSAIGKEMEHLAGDAVKNSGLKNGPFNVEFFYNRSDGSCQLLEINPLLSSTHSRLFELVDGVPHEQLMVDHALNLKPRLENFQGKYKCASRFYVRAYSGARVSSMPSDKRTSDIEKEFPDSKILLLANEGKELSSLEDQDSYSYELAGIWIGAQTQRELRRKYRKILKKLSIQLQKDGVKRIVRG